MNFKVFWILFCFLCTAQIIKTTNCGSYCEKCFNPVLDHHKKRGRGRKAKKTHKCIQCKKGFFLSKNQKFCCKNSIKECKFCNQITGECGECQKGYFMQKTKICKNALDEEEKLIHKGNRLGQKNGRRIKGENSIFGYLAEGLIFALIFILIIYSTKT